MRAITHFLRVCLLAALVGTLAGALTGTASAQSDAAIQSQDTNTAGIVADIVQVRRKDGVVTVRVRLRNTALDATSIWLQSGSADFDKYYLTAGETKYMILRDSQGTTLAEPEDYASIPGGGSFTWWAKFAAPPPEVTELTFYTPLSPPFEDLPISE